MTDNAFFSYEATFFNEDEKKSVTECGIVCGKTFTDAVEFIESYYGDELASLQVTWITSEFPLIIEKNALKKIVDKATL